MTGASVSTAVRSVVESSCAVISMSLRGKYSSQPSVETAPCGCVRYRQAQAVRGPQAPRPTGDGGATAPRAPARPAIVSLQGSIDQGGGPVQGGVSAAHRCAPPRTARLREACQSTKALWHGVGSTPRTSRGHTSLEQG